MSSADDSDNEEQHTLCRDQDSMCLSLLLWSTHVGCMYSKPAGTRVVMKSTSQRVELLVCPKAVYWAECTGGQCLSYSKSLYCICVDNIDKLCCVKGPKNRVTLISMYGIM